MSEGPPPTPSQGPIFIIGSGRSGTSLLRAMLNAHPRIYLVQEASFLSYVARLPEWVSKEDKLDLYLRSFSFAWLRVPTDTIDRDASLIEIYQDLLQRLARRHGKTRWGEKNPVNTFQLPTIFESFPDARVIDMVRDPRAQTLSHTRMPWSTASYGVIVSMLARREEVLEPFKDRILRLRLEDLIADPRSVVAQALEFVGEEWDDDVLDYQNVEDKNGIPFPWLTMAHGKRRRRLGAAWKDELHPAWIRRIETSCASLMEEFGYDRAKLEREPSAWDFMRTRLTDTPERIRHAWRRTRAFARIAGRPPADAAEGQRLICNTNPRAWKRRPDWKLPDPPEIVTTDRSRESQPSCAPSSASS